MLQRAAMYLIPVGLEEEGDEPLLHRKPYQCKPAKVKNVVVC